MVALCRELSEVGIPSVQRVLRTRWRVLCSKLKNQPSERTRQKQSLTTVGSGIGVGVGVLTSQNNFETEYQMN
ncbi:unnamed protein product [Trichobilharzia regenti]|nr:unnamed protein product [Trichobilharzia regenti]